MPVRPKQEAIESFESSSGCPVRKQQDGQIIEALKAQNCKLKKLLDIARLETKDLRSQLSELEDEN